MARVFLSHSSRDNEAAARMKAWLEGQHFEAPFLDFDKHSGIPPGADWEKTLYDEIRRSQALLILQTPNWNASRWCFAEFTQARALGKPVFQVIEDDGGAAEPPISRDLQRLDLRSERESGLDALKKQLILIAEQDQGGFPWPPPDDPHRPPFPGLMRFEEKDAAVFFGRDGDWRAVIEKLNSRRVLGGPRLLVLDGPSGTGKSSLLRAGVLPRLQRAGKQWIILPTIRPQRKPLTTLAKCLALALNRPADQWEEVHQSLLESASAGSLIERLQKITNCLQIAAGAIDAQILLPIDQGEELFGMSEPEEADTFLKVLAEAVGASYIPIQALLAIRADVKNELASVHALVNQFESLTLGPMPMERYRAVIKGPAQVAGLKVDDEFIDTAVRDSETRDALPLLAVALHDLYKRVGKNAPLSMEAYHSMGNAAEGLTPVANAVRKIADEALAEVNPTEDILLALKASFVPAMVRLTEQGGFARRPARWNDLPAAAYPLLDVLVQKRLLVKRQENGQVMVEVAHEALLRTWPTLKGWLDESRQELKQQRMVYQLWEAIHNIDNQPEARLGALRSLIAIAEYAREAVQCIEAPLLEVLADGTRLIAERLMILRLLGKIGSINAEKAIGRLLVRERLRAETDRLRVSEFLKLLFTADSVLRKLLSMRGSSCLNEKKDLVVPTATIRGDGGAVSTGCVRISLGRSPMAETMPIPPMDKEEPLAAWCEELISGVALTMICIPAGKFYMGSPDAVPERCPFEDPFHLVKLQGFLLSQAPITQAQWRAVANWQQREGEKWHLHLKLSPSRFQGERARLLEGENGTEDRPVENVSWLEAMEFCSRLSQRTGRLYTLPSEAQWEYACRAGTSTHFTFGEKITPELANCNCTSTYGDGVKSEFHGQTNPVGMLPANPWGIRDLHGNVWEWCLDHWHDSYQGAPCDGRAWVDPQPAEDRDRVLRGGSWSSVPTRCRSAFRFHSPPEHIDGHFGFRVVCLPQGQCVDP